MRTAVAIGICSLLMTGCKRNAQDSVEALASEFVYQTLAFSPVSATQAGYHTHEGKSLDSLLDDYSEAALSRQRDFYNRFKARVQQAGTNQNLTASDRADLDIMRDQIELALLELNVIRAYTYNPTQYVEAIGNALYGPYILAYAPATERFSHIIARLKAVSAFLARAKNNLRASPSVWTRVAQEENDGNIGLIDKTLRSACPPELKTQFDDAASPAIDALHEFNAWLKSDLSKRETDWRLGPEKYAAKFRYALGTDRSPADVLRDATVALESTREQMAHIAGSEGVEKALDRIAQKHAAREEYFDTAKRDLAEATAFVRDHNFVPLPPGGNLEVIPTPEFMRGAYGVGGFAPAPPLEPKLGAYYWITPIPDNWPKPRAESKLREYNFYGLKILTVHEAMPGHWVQAQYANQVRPEARKLLRAVYGNVPYVEGWAVYATAYLIQDGYYKDDPGMQLTWSKQLLRVIANTILDIRLQTMNMSDQEALDLMIKDTYQEREEAIAKLQRAQLSSCQLPTYFLGWHGWSRLRQEVRNARGSSWNESEFHKAALEQGAVPLPSLRTIVLKQ